VVLPAARADGRREALIQLNDFDVVTLDGDLAEARNYADGRSSYLARFENGQFALACFERAMVFEADLVRIQELTGALVVQRTPVLEVVRVFVDDAVVSWDGRHWQTRPTALAVLPALRLAAPELRPELVERLLTLAIHWLAPSRIGATVVIAHDEIDPSAFDFTTAAHTPPLSFANRRHFSAIQAVLTRHDLAVVADRSGAIAKVAVGLRWSDAAESAGGTDRGMRHRSAERFSHDHSDVTVLVVSEDGPVTVFRNGDVVVTTRNL
jgi:DNA integrity scanning protein DisA with diadenylate cyclase activity